MHIFTGLSRGIFLRYYVSVSTDNPHRNHNCDGNRSMQRGRGVVGTASAGDAERDLRGGFRALFKLRETTPTTALVTPPPEALLSTRLTPQRDYAARANGLSCMCPTPSPGFTSTKLLHSTGDATPTRLRTPDPRRPAPPPFIPHARLSLSPHVVELRSHVDLEGRHPALHRPLLLLILHVL